MIEWVHVSGRRVRVRDTWETNVEGAASNIRQVQMTRDYVALCIDFLFFMTFHNALRSYFRIIIGHPRKLSFSHNKTNPHPFLLKKT